VLVTAGRVLAEWRRPTADDLTVVHSLGTHGLVGLFLPPGGRTVVVPWGSEVRAAASVRWRGAVARRLLARADLVLTTSRSMAADVVSTWGVAPARVATLSWGVDEVFLRGEVSRDGVRDLRAQLGFGEEEVVVLAPRGAGRVYRTAEIVAAFGRARQRRPKLRLVVTGVSGLEHRALAGLGPADPPGVTALPHLPADQLADLYRASDAVVSVPVGDQRSSSVLEAVAGGAHLLVAPLPAYREIAADGAVLRLLDEPLPAALLDGFLHVPRRDDRVAAGNRVWALTHERREACFQEIVTVCAGGGTA
jgi:glycosyltransferase involved in cell wall biosynthesis